jgi:hypothetical protein
MFSLNNFRTNLTQKLDDITVFRKYRDGSGVLNIEERDIKEQTQESALLKIEAIGLPSDNIWIFENEFNHENFKNKDKSINDQKGAFTSAGCKVEKTIIWYNTTLNRFYICMIEMKRTLHLKNISDVKLKYESALSTMSIFIAANSDFTNKINAEIYPVGICCFNMDSNHVDADSCTHSTSVKRVFQNQYVKAKKYDFYIQVVPVALDVLEIPMILYKNPSQNPATDNFQIDFNDIIQRATTISVAPIPPKTTIF